MYLSISQIPSAIKNFYSAFTASIAERCNGKHRRIATATIPFCIDPPAAEIEALAGRTFADRRTPIHAGLGGADRFSRRPGFGGVSQSDGRSALSGDRKRRGNHFLLRSVAVLAKNCGPYGGRTFGRPHLVDRQSSDQPT